MKATILNVEGPNEGNTFVISVKVENANELFEDKIQCVSMQNIESVVSQYLKDLITLQQFKGKIIEVK